MATTAAVDHDISLLVGEIRRLGVEQADGSCTTTFGTLFADDKVQNTLESLAGTLKAAKRKKIIKVIPYTAQHQHCTGTPLRCNPPPTSLCLSPTPARRSTPPSASSD